MITFTVSRVQDEKSLLELLDSLAERHGVRARYLQPCLSKTYQVCVEGKKERELESELAAHASRVGWLVDHKALSQTAAASFAHLI